MSFTNRFDGYWMTGDRKVFTTCEPEIHESKTDITVATIYWPPFARLAKMLDGWWDADNELWHFHPDLSDKVYALVDQCFRTADGAAPDSDPGNDVGDYYDLDGDY